MRALNRFIDQKRDELVALAATAVEYAERNPQDLQAQRNASVLADAAAAGRRVADVYRYGRAPLVFGSTA